MVTLSSGMLIALIFTGAITCIAMLSVFANVIGHETQLHDLRNRVKDLQFEHAMYLARINGQIPDPKDDDTVKPNAAHPENAQDTEVSEPALASSISSTDTEIPETVQSETQQPAAAA